MQHNHGGGFPPPPADDDQPVAYDQYGRPLYAHPPAQQRPQIVQVTRPIDPIRPTISPEVLKRHEASREKYPQLNLSKGEYIISAVKRHPIGLVKIWGIALLLMAAAGAFFYFMFMGDNPAVGSAMGGGDFVGMAVAFLGAFSVLIVLGAMVATYVYNSNRFYLTNESVIQEIQATLFSKQEQTVSLFNIEDASFKQDGLVPLLFNYGTIRLSTEGDETTYIFTYVANPKKHIAVLNNAVEAFKNGRPVELPPGDD